MDYSYKNVLVFECEFLYKKNIKEKSVKILTMVSD